MIGPSGHLNLQTFSKPDTSSEEGSGLVDHVAAQMLDLNQRDWSYTA